MKILTGIDIPFVPYGGSPIICNDWYSNLPENIEVRFLTFPPNDQKYAHWWTIDDVDFLNIEKKRKIEEYPEYIETLKETLKEHIEVYKPDVIHCQHLNFGFSRAIAELKLDIPTIGICHGTDVQMASTSDFFLQNMLYIRENMDVLVFPAQRMADDYFAIDPVEKRHVIIPHGIPNTAFKKRQKPFSTSPLRLFYAGRLNSYKGADIAVEAMQYLKEKNVHLTVIGRADEAGFDENLHEIVKQHGLEKQVTFGEQLPRMELFDAMENYDCMLFPSRKLEAFAITTIEAQARGLPITVAKGGGIENAVNKSGMVVEANEPRDWANKIKYLLENPTLLEQFQRSGYANAEKHRLSKIRNKYFELSKSLL